MTTRVVLLFCCASSLYASPPNVRAPIAALDNTTYDATWENALKLSVDQAENIIRATISDNTCMLFGQEQAVGVIKGKRIEFFPDRIEMSIVTPFGFRVSGSDKGIWRLADLTATRVYRESRGTFQADALWLEGIRGADGKPWPLMGCQAISRELKNNPNVLADSLRRLYEEYSYSQGVLVLVRLEAAHIGSVIEDTASLPEVTRRYVVQAEAAVRETRFNEAEALYEMAVDASPTWAAGYYNLAFVQSGLKHYQSAADSMQLYLLLAPHAPDARAARDKIYEWQGLGSVQPLAGRHAGLAEFARRTGRSNEARRWARIAAWEGGAAYELGYGAAITTGVYGLPPDYTEAESVLAHAGTGGSVLAARWLQLAKTLEVQSFPRGHIGVQVPNAAEDAAAGGVTPVSRATVLSVLPGGGAASAGVQAGDVLVEINGHRIADPFDVFAATWTIEPGRSIKVRVLRNGSDLEISDVRVTK